ncbi:MAG: alkaline phosphatase D family protein [Microthrixaceae bacterium]
MAIRRGTAPARQVSRRRVLLGGAGAAGALTVAGCTTYPGLDPVDGPWDCGVVSGLHAHDAAVLWTRFAPAAADEARVSWEVSADPGFTSVVARGNAMVDGSTDGTLKVLAEGLAPATTYWYRFSAGAERSPVGRTRTLPHPDAEPERMRLAVASCQKFSAGWYPAWRQVAAAELDAVVFLGDYIYESTGKVNPLWDVRDDPSEAAKDLDTYRAKYRMYRGDRDLQAAHAAHAFAPIWDDHEFHDNYDRNALAADPDRASAAYQAWFEYQPVWPIDGTRIYRNMRFGRLADLSLLDTRQYRDDLPEQDILVFTMEPPGSVAHDAGRTLMGATQRDWLLDGLGAAEGDGVTWKVIGQQVMMAPLRILDLDEPFFGAGPEHRGWYFNLDQWDGYTAERDLLTGFLESERISGATVLTGDIHSFWQSSIHSDMEDHQSPVVAQEFVCGSISSTALSWSPELADIAAQVTKGTSPDFRWVDWQRRGYGYVEATRDGLHVEFRGVDPRWRNSPVTTAVSFDQAAGASSLDVTT